MMDPLTDVVKLLEPRAILANPITGRGCWAVRYPKYGRPSFCIMLEGSCRLAVDGFDAVTLEAGDFVLLTTTPAFIISSLTPASPIELDPTTIGGHGTVRYGEQDGPDEMRSLGGAFSFAAADTSVLVGLLPGMIHARGATLLGQLVSMVTDEYDRQALASDFVLSRLVEVMLIEAIRSTSNQAAPAGLLRGLADERVACALQQMHAHPDRAWTVGELARCASLSRSAFFERFTRLVGVAPMEYLAAWRIETAKHLLRSGKHSVAEVAERVGYASSSTFSTAFSKAVGSSPRSYAQAAHTKPR